MELTITNNKSETSFTRLNRIKCVQSKKYGTSMCTSYERRVADELRALAEKNRFFKDYDVDADINVTRIFGASLTMRCKPVAKTFKDKVKNLFSKEHKLIKLSDKHICPDDSSFFLAKEVRKIGKSDKLYKLLAEEG